MFGSALGSKPLCQRIINFSMLVEAFLLYITIHSVFPPHMRLRRRFLKILGSSFPALKAPGELRP
jgi:hypothetical protein